MYIYNNTKDYKTVKHAKFSVIKGKGVGVTSPQKLNSIKTNKLKKFKPLRQENIDFLKQLGFKVIKKSKNK